MVVNRDDARVAAHGRAGPVPVKGRAAKPVERAGDPLRPRRAAPPGDFGLVTENGMAWLVRALDADETSRGQRAAQPADEELFICSA